MPRILLVGPDLCGGGGERHFANLGRHLFGGSSDVLVLKNTLSDDQRADWGQRVTDLGWSSRMDYLRMVRQIKRILKSNEYDCCFGFGIFPSVLLYLASRGSCRSSIITMEITRPIAAMKDAAIWRKILYSKMRSVTFRGSNLFVANSLDGIFESVDQLGVDRSRACKVPNIVEGDKIKTLSRQHNPYSADRPYIVCVTRLVQLKRLDDIIQAFAVSPISTSVGLVIVGSGPEKQRLISLSATLGVAERVKFAGYTDNPFTILNGATAFVTASEYEGFSNSVLEAMFSDVPVITSFCSLDAREMCDQGAALGFEVGDQTQLAEHIANVVGDKFLRERLVGRAWKYCRAHALENAIPFYEGLIRQVASSSDGQPASLPS